MINNQKIRLTKDSLLQHVSEEDIIRKYFPSKFSFNTVFSSPFRKDDKPSFSIRPSHNKVMFKDFATGESGNAFDFVKKLYKLDNFLDVLFRITIDFGLTSYFDIDVSKYKKIPIKIAKYENVKAIADYDEIFIKLIPKEWEPDEIQFWNNVGVSTKLATKAWITPIHGYSLNGTIFYTPDLTFGYGELKDGKWTYKIYRPFNKLKKWVNNNNSSVIELWHLLPETGDTLCITSSRKDALSIMSILGIPAISFQGESVTPKKVIMDELKRRFKYIFILYDNDIDGESNWGQILAQKIVDLYPYLINVVIPNNAGTKDSSDTINQYGVEKGEQILRQAFKIGFNARKNK